MSSTNKSLAPVVLFTYNRLWHLNQTIEALLNNSLAGSSELFVYSDGAKSREESDKVNQVREYIKSIKGFKKVKIIERETNYGLANNIVDGVTKIVNEYGKIIVLEDDLITAPYFLKFMNDSLNVYENEKNVCEVIGYSYFEKYIEQYDLDELLFIKGADCLGWATWKRAWNFFNPDSKELLEIIQKKNLVEEFNWNGAYDYFSLLKKESEGKVGSWAVKWLASAFVNNLYTFCPSKSLVLHIGNDAEGTNYRFIDDSMDPINVPIFSEPIEVKKIDVFQKENTKDAYTRFLSHFNKSLYQRAVNKIKWLLR